MREVRLEPVPAPGYPAAGALSARAQLARLWIRSWFDHSVRAAEVLGESVGLPAELEELRQRKVELIGGLRSLDLRAREPETRIDDVERGRLPLTKREILEPDVLFGARD